MDQNKSNLPKLFVCTVIENKDEVEEVGINFTVSQQRIVLVGHVES